jgi:peptidoglycan/xylan/chitin deacetylase (PgdA/CDA1 family)
MPQVTLTFDNGPDPNVTPYVLDCLERHEVKSTFFVIGSRVAEAARAAAARDAAQAGHRIGNHTWSHTTPLGELDAAAALAEFERAEQALDWLDQPMRLFRPYGRGGKLGTHLLHPAVVEKLCTQAYTCVLWKFVSGDWRDPDGWMARALADCRASEWSLVVLHDIPSGAMLHLDEFIRILKQEGMELTQHYPPDCVPIANGKIVLPIEPYCSSGILR